GRTVLSGPFDATFWEGIPVTLAEVDRIEVVEGPASALYGANAINGVINIITRTPEQLRGGELTYTVGERRTHLGSLLYGKRDGRIRYKAGVGLRTTNRFEDANLRASEGGKAHAALGYDFSGGSRLDVSGGFSNHNTQYSTGTPGESIYDGATGFLRMDYSHRETRVQAFWNRGRPSLNVARVKIKPYARSDTYDASVIHTLLKGGRNRLVVGGSFRRNTIHSNFYMPMRVEQNLWALFFEDAWQAASWAFVTSARLDRHPLTGWVFSPRGSLVYSPSGRHTFRISAGSSFRNPTLTESYLNLQQSTDSGFNIPIDIALLGNTELEPERMVLVEAAYTGRFGLLKVGLAGFRYWLKDVIAPEGDQFGMVPGPPPKIEVQTRYYNIAGETRGWGGEASVELAVNRQVKLFANYSLQRFSGELDFLVAAGGGPEHKVNGGVQVRTGGWTSGLWAHRVSATVWNAPSLRTLDYLNLDVGAYVLLNAHLGYTFSGTLKGLELGIDAFNLADNEHLELAPAVSELEPGHSGEVLKRRLTATASYQF
ncbi:MAG: TonB-dependent receptor, partial [bacterium]|nr:TonB-dependent receptor [bacterium]